MNPTGDYTVHFADPDMYVRSVLVFRCFLNPFLLKILPMARYIAGRRPTSVSLLIDNKWGKLWSR